MGTESRIAKDWVDGGGDIGGWVVRVQVDDKSGPGVGIEHVLDAECTEVLRGQVSSLHSLEMRERAHRCGAGHVDPLFLQLRPPLLGFLGDLLAPVHCSSAAVDKLVGIPDNWQTCRRRSHKNLGREGERLVKRMEEVARFSPPKSARVTSSFWVGDG